MSSDKANCVECTEDVGQQTSGQAGAMHQQAEGTPATSGETLSSNVDAMVTINEDVMVPSTFVKPDLRTEVHVVIEYCNRCRWYGNTFVLTSAEADRKCVGTYRNARATWTQTELLNTFSPSGDSEDTSDSSPSTISAITIVPRSDPATAGRFRIWLYRAGEEQPLLVHDRKTEGGFTEMKIIKQRIREIIAPNKGLGHSDKPGKNRHTTT